MDRTSDADSSAERLGAFVESIAALLKAASRPEVIRGTGLTDGVFSIPASKYRNLALVSSVNGVGAKLRLALMTKSYETIGYDLVAVGVNSVLVHGAEPLFFQDYFASGELVTERAQEILRGMAEGCREAGCAFLGGQVAERPALFADGALDLAGFTVGAVEREERIDGSSMGIGTAVIAIGTPGLNIGCYSPASRLLFDEHHATLGDTPAVLGGETVAAALMKPSSIYARVIQNLRRDFMVLAIGHIAGGGVLRTLSRFLPGGCKVALKVDAWPRPPLFDFLQSLGEWSDERMLGTFNLGLGMVVLVPRSQAQDVLDRLASLGEDAYQIGAIIRRAEDEPTIQLDG